MIGLEKFQTAATQSVRGNTQIVVDAQREGVKTRSGRIARWAGNLKHTQNREVHARFTDALRSRFGSAIADDAATQSGISRRARSGKPLSARAVKRTISNAQEQQATQSQQNAAMATMISSKVAGRAGHEQGLTPGEVAAKNYPKDPTMHTLVDASRVAHKVHEAIEKAGNEGTKRLSETEARKIAEDVTLTEIDKARHKAYGKAFERVDLDNPESMAAKALARGLGTQLGGLGIRAEELSPDLKSALQSKLEDAIQTKIPAQNIHDKSQVTRVIGQTLNEFVESRIDLCKAAGNIDIDDAAKGKLLRQALHDTTTPQLLEAGAQAYERTRDDVRMLAARAGTGDAAGASARIAAAMGDAFAHAKVEIDVMNQDAHYRTMWRAMLAPHGAAKQALRNEMANSESSLREVAEGGAWMRREFGQTERAAETVIDTSGREVPKHAETMQNATRLSVTTEALATVLSEGPRGGPKRFGLDAESGIMQSREPRSDATIAALRDIGIAVPAQSKIGETNPDAALARTTIVAIERNLNDHLQKTEHTAHHEGVLVEAHRDFDRSTYSVAGHEIARDKNEVQAAMTALCTDANGKLDEQALSMITRLAYQATPLVVLRELTSLQSPETALMSDMPVMGNSTKVSYDIARSDSGDIEVTTRFVGKPANAIINEDDGPPGTQALDPERSEVSVTMVTHVGADNQAQVREIHVGYALTPAPEDTE